MERRVHRRFARRVEIRFWRHGESQGHSAFTTNISKTGLFLGSASSLSPGERLRLELVEPERGFVIEGRVARVYRVSLALRHVEQPGVGVRFLPPEELIDGFLPMEARQDGPAEPMRAATGVPALAAGDANYSEATSSGFGRYRPAAQEAPPERSPGSAPSTGSSTARTANGAAPDAAATPPPTVDLRLKIVPVRFDDASTFLSVYHRDIQSGGLFVSSAEPVELNEVVWVELRLPLPDTRPELFQARVVQRFESEAAVGTGRNLLAGMAMQFLDPEQVVSTLKPLLARIRGT